jgi:hypothetical protein
MMYSPLSSHQEATSVTPPSLLPYQKSGRTSVTPPPPHPQQSILGHNCRVYL